SAMRNNYVTVIIKIQPTVFIFRVDGALTKVICRFSLSLIVTCINLIQRCGFKIQLTAKVVNRDCVELCSRLGFFIGDKLFERRHISLPAEIKLLIQFVALGYALCAASFSCILQGSTVRWFFLRSLPANRRLFTVILGNQEV